ncbi:MAG: glycosyltransferase family 1 protein [Thiocapsa sp.]|uniref:glycosyltransferase n=1 Tax=Thiocapsa sp. TaxID=2024551 RepID=UPI001BCBCF0C|nr:glycosyltransferase [Thiocapsa sp.]QVL50086.1 MAG: glycosyltransferase family 1 protein [Thiocapsa sp.]
MSILVLWARFGAYHLARLRGLAEVAGGVGRGVVGVEVAGQDHYGWDVCSGAAGFERRTLFPNQRYGDLEVRKIRLGVLTALDTTNPDVVAVNGWGVPEARAAIGWCRRRGVPAVLMSETKADDGGAPRRWWKEAVKRRLVERCDAALVGGRMQAAYLADLGFSRERIILGYDAVDNDYFAKGATAARADAVRWRAETGLPKRYFFACTRLLPRKNVDGLLRAYAEYRRRCREVPWDLVIAGSGEEASALFDLERHLGVHGVHWVGFLQYEQLPIYFGLASAFVHPAKSEPWGLVVNEAAASGLPLLVGRTVGAAYELVGDGDNGILFDAGRDTDITRALLAAGEASAEARAAMAERSVAIVAEWSPRRFGEQMMAAVRAAEVVSR